MTSSGSPACPLCGLRSCAAPAAGATRVGADLLRRLQTAVSCTPALGLPVVASRPGVPPATFVAHPLRVRWTATAASDLPPDTVDVGHGPWSTPFDAREHGPDAAVARYREWLLARPALLVRARRELAGRRLACGCSLTVACHADVLLEVADARVRPVPGRPRPVAALGPAARAVRCIA